MHIGLIIYGNLNIVSGGYLYNRKLVEYWRTQGHKVTIFSRPWRNYWRHFEDNISPAWRKLIQEANVDIWVQDELNHPSLIGINPGLKKLSVPLVAIIHLLRATEPHSRLSTPFYRRVERRYLDQMHGLIYNSHHTADAVQNIIQRRPQHVVAYPGKDHLKQQITAAEIKSRNLSPGPLKILYVGNYIHRKGLDILLEALAKLGKNTFQLTAIGRRDLEPRFVKKIEHLIHTLGLSKRVELLGPRPMEKMAEIYHTHQLFIMPSRFEPFGIVYLEAMGAGLPVIGSTAGAGEELIAHQKSGFLVDPENGSQLAQQISFFLENRPALVEMGLAGKKIHDNHPTWDQSGLKITRFLEKLTTISP